MEQHIMKNNRNNLPRLYDVSPLDQKLILSLIPNGIQTKVSKHDTKDTGLESTYGLRFIIGQSRSTQTTVTLTDVDFKSDKDQIINLLAQYKPLQVVLASKTLDEFLDSDYAKDIVNNNLVGAYVVMNNIDDINSTTKINRNLSPEERRQQQHINHHKRMTIFESYTIDDVPLDWRLANTERVMERNQIELKRKRMYYNIQRLVRLINETLIELGYDDQIIK